MSICRECVFGSGLFQPIVYLDLMLCCVFEQLRVAFLGEELCNASVLCWWQRVRIRFELLGERLVSGPSFCSMFGGIGVASLGDRLCNVS